MAWPSKSPERISRPVRRGPPWPIEGAAFASSESASSLWLPHQGVLWAQGNRMNVSCRSRWFLWPASLK